MALKGLVRRKTVAEVFKERKLLTDEQIKTADDHAMTTLNLYDIGDAANVLFFRCIQLLQVAVDRNGKRNGSALGKSHDRCQVNGAILRMPITILSAAVIRSDRQPQSD